MTYTKEEIDKAVSEAIARNSQLERKNPTAEELMEELE